MNRAVIEERVHAAIRPQLARADRALWELQNPRVTIGRHTEEGLIRHQMITGANLEMHSITMRYWIGKRPQPCSSG